MGRRIPLLIALAGLAALVSSWSYYPKAFAVSPAWPAALTGVTPEVVGRMELPLRERVLALAEKFGERTDVPYVWGGDAIGDPEQCQACRACALEKGKKRIKGRLKACAPCRACGIDCSHFAARFFRAAGMDLPFASTGELKRLSRSELKERFGLIDVGRNLADARPGDILLHDRHMTILLELRSATHGDVLHASRSYKRGTIGGIEIARNKNLLRFRGRMIKILRRVELAAEDDVLDPQFASRLPSE